jgi:hypothetical protein
VAPRRPPASSGDNWQRASKRISEALRGDFKDYPSEGSWQTAERVADDARSEREPYRSYKSTGDLANEAGFDWGSVFDPISIQFTRVTDKGPQKSTRVSAIQFGTTLSDDELRQLFIDVIENQLSSQMLETQITGYMYVKWVKGSNLSSYGPITAAEYKSRVAGGVTSWGKAVKNWGGYSYDSSPVAGVSIQ